MIEHAARDVEVVYTRLPTPDRTGIRLLGRQGEMLVAYPYADLKHVRAALTENGFAITDRTSWGVDGLVQSYREQKRTSLSMWWALLAFCSFGVLGWAPFVYASLRTANWRWRNWAIVYASGAVAALGNVSIVASHAANGRAGTVSVMPLMLLAVVTAVHALAIREDYADQLAARREPALLLADRHVELRRRARRLVAQDPQRAREMGIGRPDVPESFDAGLVDINHADAPTLATLPGINAVLAARIVELRSEGTGFTSLADFDLAFDLSRADLQDLQELAVFVRG